MSQCKCWFHIVEIRTYHDSGATFVILSKAKGWYIVQKDPDGMGKIVPDQAKSGWVPAGASSYAIK